MICLQRKKYSHILLKWSKRNQQPNQICLSKRCTAHTAAEHPYFSRHPFRLYDGERLNDLVESVKVNGILVPVIVRRISTDENGYEFEMLAGHNRQHAASIIGLDTIPCIVKENLSDEDTWIYVIETNVMQRSFTLHHSHCACGRVGNYYNADLSAYTSDGNA